MLALLGPFFFSLALGAPFDRLPAHAQKAWARLLHYGRADGPQFYLTDTRDPAQELEASARLLPQRPCDFPARVMFLQEWKLWDVPAPVCPEFDEWKKGLSGKERVALVFSTAYPNNPASLFGHVFLRFKAGTGNELLDYTASFSAVVDEGDPGVLYALKGLFGGYPGHMDFAPYYLKVQEYNNSEGRDLFEYDLNLPPERASVLVAHLWEIYAHTWLDYWFLDENCAFVLAAALEAAMPEWELTRAGRWYFLPADMLRALGATPGALTATSMRPSLHKAWSAGVQALSEEERAQLGREDAPAHVLNVTLAQLAIRERRSKGHLSVHDKALRQRLLLARARHGIAPAKTPEFPRDQAPELGAGPMKFQLAPEWRSTAGHGHGLWEHARLKLGYHDLMERDAGYGAFSHFDFFGATLSRSHRDGNWRLSEVRGVEITSLHPMRPESRSASWTLGATYERLDDVDCWGCEGLKGRAGAGAAWAWDLPTGEARPFILAGAFTQASKALEKGARLGSWIEYGAYSQLGEKAKAQLTQRGHWDLWGRQREWTLKHTAALSWFPAPAQEIRLNFDVSQRWDVTSFQPQRGKVVLRQLGAWFGLHF